MKKRVLTNFMRRASYIHIYYSIFIKIYTDMTKKRKLNSKNPKYRDKSADNSPKIKKRVKMCDATIRSYGGVDTGRTAEVYAVFYED